MSPERANPLAGAANLRGGILIAVAVVVGVILLGKGFDTGFIGSSGGDPSDEATGGSSDDGGSEGEDGTDASTTTTVPLHNPAEVRVQVLNSTGPAGSAGAASTAVSAAGFVALDPTNATDRAATATAIFAAPGYEGDAAAIAAALGIGVAPQPMPSPPPPPAPADANIVIVLGPDFVVPA